jgi:hypothetical protein
MDEHDCLGFWGHWVDLTYDGNIIGILDRIAYGDVLRMSPATYNAMSQLQRTIERALDLGDPQINDWTGGGVPSFPESDEILMCYVINQLISGLSQDENDLAGPGQHNPPVVIGPPSWMYTGHRQQATHDVTKILSNPGSGGPPDGNFGTDLLGRVKSSLGST